MQLAVGSKFRQLPAAYCPLKNKTWQQEQYYWQTWVHRIQRK